MKSRPHENLLSEAIESWLISDSPKTIKGAMDVFADKFIPVLIVLLMFLPALPLPTGLLSQVFEIITVALALQMFTGIDKVLLPRRLLHRTVPKVIETAGLTQAMKQLRRIERHSRARGDWVIASPRVRKLTALLAVLGAAAAFFSPPFSMLDTLPSLGVVVLMIGYTLGDAIFWLVGLIVMMLGIALELVIGALVYSLVSQISIFERTTLALLGALLALAFYLYYRRHKA